MPSKLLHYVTESMKAADSSSWNADMQMFKFTYYMLDTDLQVPRSVIEMHWKETGYILGVYVEHNYPTSFDGDHVHLPTIYGYNTWQLETTKSVKSILFLSKC